MPRPVLHDLGPVDGACRSCGVEGCLRLGEVQLRRSPWEALSRTVVGVPARFVGCGRCGWRWSVRAGDVAADGWSRRGAGAGTRRREGEGVPGPAATAARRS